MRFIFEFVQFFQIILVSVVSNCKRLSIKALVRECDWMVIEMREMLVNSQVLIMKRGIYECLVIIYMIVRLVDDMIILFILHYEWSFWIEVLILTWRVKWFLRYHWTIYFTRLNMLNKLIWRMIVQVLSIHLLTKRLLLYYNFGHFIIIWVFWSLMIYLPNINVMTLDIVELILMIIQAVLRWTKLVLDILNLILSIWSLNFYILNLILVR